MVIALDFDFMFNLIKFILRGYFYQKYLGILSINFDLASLVVLLTYVL